MKTLLDSGNNALCLFPTRPSRSPAEQPEPDHDDDDAAHHRRANSWVFQVFDQGLGEVGDVAGRGGRLLAAGRRRGLSGLGWEGGLGLRG